MGVCLLVRFKPIKCHHRIKKFRVVIFFIAHTTRIFNFIRNEWFRFIYIYQCCHYSNQSKSRNTYQ